MNFLGIVARAVPFVLVCAGVALADGAPAKIADAAPPTIVDRACAAPCAIRNPSGECVAFGPEVCGPGYTCVSRCLSRLPTGDCSAYTTDFCGAKAVCEKECLGTDRGKCIAYGADRCRTGF